jgi:hypothetical protein
MMPDLIAEDKLVQNVVRALRLALDERRDGCLEVELWHGVAACLVPRPIFDEAIDIMLTAGWVQRSGARLHGGVRRAPPFKASAR